MLLLFETAAGFALFKVNKEDKLDKAEDVYKDFETLEAAQKVVKLKAFSKFDNTTEALAAATALVESKLSKGLRKFLKQHATGDTLAVLDAKLGGLIRDKLGITCLASNSVQELARGVRNQLSGLISDLGGADLTPMSLGLSHSLSRYKLKFSPDKVDTMIVQAIGLLDDLDKELNTYAMRLREWYGWHFPEMTRLVADNIAYARTIQAMGTRDRAAAVDLSGVLEAEAEAALRGAAAVSMGTEISGEDLANITALANQVVELGEYRGQLWDYLRARMAAVAPNLTVLVGELVGARLIAHAGSLINLAKQPASTVQILGAEKALFRALKTKHETPKYGLIYHASLIGQSQPKFKGKISRVLAAKAALATRVDALGDTTDAALGTEARAKVEARLRQLEGRSLAADSGRAKGKQQPGSYGATKQQAAGAALLSGAAGRGFSAAGDVAEPPAQEGDAKQKKKRKADQAAAAAADGDDDSKENKHKKKKKQEREGAANGEAAPQKAKKAKAADDGSDKKKKKKKKQADE